MGNPSFTAREVEVLRISSDGDLFFGLKFSIPGFFWVGKFGKYFYRWLDFWGIRVVLRLF